MGKVTRIRPDGDVVRPGQTRSLADDTVAVSRARAQPVQSPERDAVTLPKRRPAGRLPTPKNRRQSMTAQVEDPLDSSSSSSTQGKGKRTPSRAAARKKNTSARGSAAKNRNATPRRARRPYARMSAPDRPHLRGSTRTSNVNVSDTDDEESNGDLGGRESNGVRLNPDLFDLNNHASHSRAVVAYLRISPTEPSHYQAYINNTDFLTEPPTQQVTVTAAQKAYYQDGNGGQFSQQRLLHSTIATEARGVTVRDVVIVLNQKHELEDGVTLRRVKTILGANSYVEIPSVAIRG